MAEEPVLPPIGWQTAVAMLRSGVPKVSVLQGLQTEIDLQPEEAAAALTFGVEWLRAARSP